MEKAVIHLMLCERCWKEIKKIGNRKYCLQCRMAVDREINSATRRKLRSEQKAVDSSGESTDLHVS